MAQTLPRKGTLEVICGSMFSGKSEELIRKIRRALIAKKNIRVFKHSLDQRIVAGGEVTKEFVTSHNGNKVSAYSVDSALCIEELTTPDIDIVGIDEAQFFTHELVDVVLRLLDNGKIVIVAGLNLDFKAVPFGPMPTLMALSDTVTKLSAICIVCGADAYFSQRLVDNKPAKYDDPLIQTGAQESYQARCRNCFVIDRRSAWQKTL
jgi:thymidine kinase